VRPVLQIELSGDPDEVMERLRSRLPDCPHCTGISVGRHAELFVPEEERRVWSPWLSVTARAASQGGAQVKGRFSPHAHVWTLYMFLAFGIGFAALVGATWGYAQWAMETAPWAWLSLPICALLGLGLYLVSITGQRLGSHQIEHLEHALEQLISEDPGGVRDPADTA
jgi:hypothetical protein